MRVLVAGGTGFIGRPLVSALRRRGDDVVVVTRSPREAGQVSYGELPEHADAVINLAGEWVAGIWTPAKKRQILDSRIETTRLLVDWMLDRSGHLPALVNASAVGYYGHRPDEVLTEESSYDPRNAFRGRVCKAWEAEANRAGPLGARVVTCRIGGVLSFNGGLLSLFEPLLKWSPFLIPPSPQKVLSWVTLEDTVRLIIFALDNDLSGPLNVTAPNPVSYREFVRGIGVLYGKPTLGSLPTWLLRLSLGENSEAITDSQHVVPQKAVRAGYEFSHSCLEEWLESERARRAEEKDTGSARLQSSCSRHRLSIQGVEPIQDLAGEQPDAERR